MEAETLLLISFEGIKLKRFKNTLHASTTLHFYGIADKSRTPCHLLLVFVFL